MFKIDVNVPQHEQIVGVRTTENRGFSPEELAEQCVEKIIAANAVRLGAKHSATQRAMKNLNQ